MLELTLLAINLTMKVLVILTPPDYPQMPTNCIV